MTPRGQTGSDVSAAAQARLDQQRATDMAQLGKHGKALFITAQITAFLIHLSILGSTWGHPRLLALQGLVWGAGAIGNSLAPLVFVRVGHGLGQILRNAFNLALHVPFAVALGWTIESWLFLPFLGALAAAPPNLNLLPRVLAHVACFNVVAALTGGALRHALVFSGVSLFFHFASNAYLRLLANLLRERDETLAELRDAQRRSITHEKMASIGQIAAGIAHEINNPMCFVTANVEAMLGDLQGGPLSAEQHEEYRREVLPETLDGIHRVNAIVDDLRRFARSEPEKLTPFDLGVEIAAAVRMAKAQLKPGQSVHVELPSRLDVVGSPRQLCQVVLNLLMNGLQALPGAGKVEVSARVKAGRVEVAVRDSGAGMDEETRQRLFEPFFSTKGRGGLGLGLSVVYGIVKAHGGSIEVESVLGRGTCFRFRLPAASDQPAAALGLASSSASSAATASA